MAYQTKNNAMTTDMDFDFTLPYNEETGEVYGDSSSVSRNEDYEWLAKELLASGKELVEKFAVVDDDEDLEESRRPIRRGRMLKETKAWIDGEEKEVSPWESSEDARCMRQWVNDLHDLVHFHNKNLNKKQFVFLCDFLSFLMAKQGQESHEMPR